MLRLRSDRSLLALLVALGALGLVLLSTAIDGVVIADEDQYLSFAVAVRQGELTVPGTSGLPPAWGLSYFSPADPTPKPVPPRLHTPIGYAVSPLHAFLAAPLTPFGWKGLVALNVFGFCLATFFAFMLARRWATRPSTPWLAAGVYFAASFSIEYAQGAWPHSLSAGLCTAAVYFAARHRSTNRAVDAAFAGLLAALAFGIRLQSLLFVVSIALGLLVFADKRWRSTTFYLLGAVIPLAACSLINHEARGVWNPIFRGTGYISTESGAFGMHPLVEWALSLYARGIDYSAYPALPGAINAYLSKEAFSGATLVAGSFKKAWLQSAPWLVIPVVALLAAWMRPLLSRSEAARASAPPPSASHEAGGHRPAPGISFLLRRIFSDEGKDRELRAQSIIVGTVLLAIATRGLMRDDGLAFNQRYLLDLMPLMAVVLAWAIEPMKLGRAPVAIGAIVGSSCYLIGYYALPLGLGLAFAMKAPLVMAGALLIGLAIRTRAPWIVVVLSACLAWATCVHLFDDLAASRNIRSKNQARMAALESELRDGDALFAFWGDKDAFGPLQMNRDLLIVDSSPDEPETLARLTRALLEKGRRVLVLPHVPADKFAAMSAGFEVIGLGPFEVAGGHPPLRLLQISSSAVVTPPVGTEASLP